ncbi:glutamate carboxypeptidase II [Sarracenia purpurea var. burkii]
MSVADRLRARMLVSGPPTRRRRRRPRRTSPSPLGSGSDYTPFLQHLGIASINLGYGGEGEGNQYHSAYDTFEWFLRFLDPDMTYGVQLAKTSGRMVMRMASADSLPMNFARFAEVVDRYAKEVQLLNKEMQDKTEETNRYIADGTLAATYDRASTCCSPRPSRRSRREPEAPLRRHRAPERGGQESQGLGRQPHPRRTRPHRPRPTPP